MFSVCSFSVGTGPCPLVSEVFPSVFQCPVVLGVVSFLVFSAFHKYYSFYFIHLVQLHCLLRVSFFLVHLGDSLLWPGPSLAAAPGPLCPPPCAWVRASRHSRDWGPPVSRKPPNRPRVEGPPWRQSRSERFLPLREQDPLQSLIPQPRLCTVTRACNPGEGACALTHTQSTHGGRTPTHHPHHSPTQRTVQACTPHTHQTHRHEFKNQEYIKLLFAGFDGL